MFLYFFAFIFFVFQIETIVAYTIPENCIIYPVIGRHAIGMKGEIMNYGVRIQNAIISLS